MTPDIREILEDLLITSAKYSNIISPTERIDQAHSAIISLILEKMPKEKLPITNNSGFTLMERVGYNSALAGMRETG